MGSKGSKVQNMDMVGSILKKQNQFLIERVSEHFKLDKERMLRTYFTPSFYSVEALERGEKMIEIQGKNIGKK